MTIRPRAFAAFGPFLMSIALAMTLSPAAFAAAAPTLTFTLGKTVNGVFPLKWSTTNAKTCTASAAWSGAKPLSGTANIGPFTPNEYVTFRLTCVGAGGSVVKKIGGTAVPWPSVTLTAAPNTVASGSSSKLTWSSTNSTSCTASGGWSGTKALNGSQSTGARTATTTYKLTCSGAGGSQTISRTVTVTSGKTPALTLSASPTSVKSGGTSKLTWAATNATSCTASGGWSGARAISGSATTAALTKNTSYTLTCNGAGGSIARTATVTIGATAPTVTFTASPTSIQAGATSKLAWNSTNATSCSASGAWSGTKAISGTQTTNALTTNATYTLACSGTGGSVSRTATVTVSAAGAPTVTLTASPTSVQSGSASQLTWSTTNATSCAASGSWSGSRGTSGTQSTGTLTANSAFTLTCAGAGGTTAVKTASVAVASGGSPSVALSANPRSVARSANSTLTWTGLNVNTCSASGGWTGSKTSSGTQSVGPITQDTTYSLTCSGTGGNSVAMTTLVLREAALSWQAPTKNVDGTPASLSGYKIYYGTASRSYSQTISVSGASTLQRTITLAPGTWYFALAAVDAQGVESAKSSEVSKFIP